MKTNDSVGVTFVNVVVGSGTFNNVINLTLGVCLFTPDAENGRVDDDIVVASRLRMDPLCARQLRDTLNRILDVPTESAKANGVADGATAAETLN